MDDRNLLMDIAQDAFYKWEKFIFPEGKTPYSDDDRMLWCEGFVASREGMKMKTTESPEAACMHPRHLGSSITYRQTKKTT